MEGTLTHSLTVLPLYTHSLTSHSYTVTLTDLPLSHGMGGGHTHSLTHSLTHLPLSHTEWRAHSLSHSLIRSSLKSHTHRVLTGVPLSQTE